MEEGGLCVDYVSISLRIASRHHPVPFLSTLRTVATNLDHDSRPLFGHTLLHFPTQFNTFPANRPRCKTLYAPHYDLFHTLLHNMYDIPYIHTVKNQL